MVYVHSANDKSFGVCGFFLYLEKGYMLFNMQCKTSKKKRRNNPSVQNSNRNRQISKFSKKKMAVAF